MIRAVWGRWALLVVVAVLNTLCSLGAANAQPAPPQSNKPRPLLIACVLPPNAPKTATSWWRYRPTGQLIVPGKGGDDYILFNPRDADFVVLSPDDASCRPAPASTAPAAKPSSKAEPPPKEAPKTGPPVAPKPQLSKPAEEPTFEQTVAKLKAEALAEMHRQAMEERKNRPPQAMASLSGEDIGAALDETEDKPRIPRLQRSFYPQPMWTSAYPGAPVGQPIDDRAAPLVICRPLPEPVGSGVGFTSAASNAAVRLAIREELTAYGAPSTEAAKEAHRKKLRELFKSIPASMAHDFREMLGSPDQFGLFFRITLARDPLKRELLEILEKKYICTPAPAAPPVAPPAAASAPTAAPPGTQLPIVTLTDPAAFGALQVFLRKRIDEFDGALNAVPRSATTIQMMQLQQASLPALRWMLRRAQETQEAAFQLPDDAQRAAGLRRAGDWFTGVIAATSMMQLDVNIALQTAWADALGVASGDLEKAAGIWSKADWPYAEDPDIRALTQAALNVNVPKMVATFPAASVRYQHYVKSLDRFIAETKRGDVLSKKVVKVADIVMIAISIYQVWKAPVISANGALAPPTVLGVLPGGAALGGTASLASVAEALESIRKLIAIGALDGAIIAGLSSMGGGPDVALPELQRPTSLSVQTQTSATQTSATGNGSGTSGGNSTPQTTPPTKEAVTFGENATSKLRSHWGDIQKLAREHGFKLPGKFKEAESQIRGFIEDAVRNGQTKIGPYKPTGGGWADARWTKYGNTIVVRAPDGKFVTILDSSGGGAALNYPGGQ